MSNLSDANAAIREGERLQQERRRARRRALAPVQAIDALIEELETLHLAGRKRVPEAWEPRLQALHAMLPEDIRHELHARMTIAHLMERLYTVQHALFARQVPRDLYADLDDDHPDGSAPTLSQAS